MKRFLFLLLLVISTIIVTRGQAPQSLNYQTVVRDTNGNLIAEKDVNFRLSILTGSESGEAVYSETQTAKSNKFGLATLKIGNGTPVVGIFSDISWVNGNYYLKTEIEQEGLTGYRTMGVSQLLSVPYALYSNQSGPTGITGQTLRHNGNSWEANSLLYNYGTKIGIGTNAPISLLHLNEALEPEITFSNTASVYKDYISNGAKAMHISSNSGYSEASSSYYVNDVGSPSFMIRLNHIVGAGGMEFMTRPGRGSGLIVTLRLSDDGKVIVPDELDIYNKIRISSGSPALNKVLLSDANGYGAWGNLITTGNNGNVLFNNNGTIGGDANLFWDNTNKYLGINNPTPANTLDVAGTINVTNKITKSSTTGDHNLLPIAYGNIKSDGTVNTGSGNFSSNWTGSSYQIIIFKEDYLYSSYITNVSILSPGPAVYARVYSSVGRLVVYLYDSSGTSVQSPFNFVTYKP